MSLSDLKAKWMAFVADLNSKGIPLPMVRDPKTGRGDVALTLVVISSIWFQLGLVGKWSKMLDGINMSEAFEFFVTCCSLYWARKLSADGSGNVNVGDGAAPPPPAPVQDLQQLDPQAQLPAQPQQPQVPPQQP